MQKSSVDPTKHKYGGGKLDHNGKRDTQISNLERKILILSEKNRELLAKHKSLNQKAAAKVTQLEREKLELEKKNVEIRMKHENQKAQNMVLQKDGTIQSFCTLLSALFKYCTYCFTAFMLYLSIKSLSGLETVALFKGILKYEGNEPSLIEQIINALPLVIAVGSIYYGYRQRQLLSSALEQVDEHKKRLEEALDPNRSSSKLTGRGETHHADL